MNDVSRTYLNEFSCWADVRGNFGGDCPVDEPKFVFAAYDAPAYEGYATVIISEDGVTFSVVEGSHCSCWGLEDQWDPTDHGEAEVRRMTVNGGFHGDPVAVWLNAVTARD